ncbi:pectin acetylesterase 8-like isoform X2 [Lycium ferocissimum]|nr:pectin acetylesterase 8-like isoform X2 [Lycium ferocissimum]
MLSLCRTEALQTLLVNITILQSAIAKGAVCLDGSAPAFLFHSGTGSGVQNWLLHLEGGGWCSTVSECLSRTNQPIGSSKNMPLQGAFTGVLSNDPDMNPVFYDWNRVKVKYCDGASFTGDIEEVDPATNLHYRGARIFKVIVEELLAKGMSSAQNVILSGTSAGGLAAILNCDKFKIFLQMDTRLKRISDAGFFLNVSTIAGKPEIKELYERVVVLHGSTKNLPPSCTSTLKPSLCFFPQYVAGYIQTPLFIINSAYDSWQVNNSLVPEGADPQGIWNNCKKNINECSPSQLNILHDFRLKFLNALTELGGTSSIGYFIISCHSHNIIERQSYWFYNNSPTLSNKTIAITVGDWFYEESVFQNTDCPYPCGQKFCH